MILILVDVINNVREYDIDMVDVINNIREYDIDIGWCNKQCKRIWYWYWLTW